MYTDLAVQTPLPAPVETEQTGGLFSSPTDLDTAQTTRVDVQWYGEVMLRFSWDGCTDLVVLHIGTLTALRYRDEMKDCMFVQLEMG